MTLPPLPCPQGPTQDSLTVGGRQAVGDPADVAKDPRLGAEHGVDSSQFWGPEV